MNTDGHGLTRIFTNYRGVAEETEGQTQEVEDEDEDEEEAEGQR